MHGRLAADSMFMHCAMEYDRARKMLRTWTAMGACRIDSVEGCFATMRLPRRLKKQRAAHSPIPVALLLCMGFCPPLFGQQAMPLPAVPAEHGTVAQRFAFASDGPKGLGWTRPDEVARAYAPGFLPALFRRRLVLDTALPAGSSLHWIFTGPHAGFTVQLTNTSVRLTERFYDSTALPLAGNYPEKIVRDVSQSYTGIAKEVAVIVDAHLSVRVQLNGVRAVEEPLVFDVTRQQLQFTGPRDKHLTVSGAWLAEDAERAQVTVHPGQQHQQMLGFGGSPSIPAYAGLSVQGKQEYWSILQRYNLLIDREYPMGEALLPDLSNVDNLRDATPHYYGDNFPNGEVSDFAYSRKTRALGGMVFYEMWSLPAWATQAYSPGGAPLIDAWGKPVRIEAKPEVYAKTVVAFCRIAKQRSGAAPEVVGIQNEVDEPPAMFAEMAVDLRRALDAAGFTKTKIHLADASFLYLAIDRTRTAQENKAEWHALDYTAAHQYDYQQFLANPDLYDDRLRAMHAASAGKPFLATEICLNDPAYQEASYRLALQMGQLYQKDLVEADAEALLYCWLLLDVEQPTFGASRALLVPDRTRGEMPVASSFQLRVLGAFSRHVRRGMRRVEGTASNPDLLTAAFTDGKRSSLVLLNRSTTTLIVDVTWPGVHWSTLERTSFYSENVEQNMPAAVRIAPGEIVTLANFSADGNAASTGPGIATNRSGASEK